MNRRRWIKALLFVALTFVVSCFGLNLLQWLHADWSADRSVLTDLPCAPPCWYGIVPGQTISEADIRTRLHSLPNFDGDWKPIEITVAWYWKQRPWRSTGSNGITNAADGVTVIALSYDFDLTVQQILEKYGLPVAVNYGPGGLPEHPYIRFNMHYPLRGVIFAARVNPFDAPILTPSTRVSEGTYIRPADSLDTWEQRLSGVKFQSWPGYGKLEVAQP